MAIGLAGPLQGNQYIIVVMLYFTKWAEMIPVSDHKAETCARMLEMNVFANVRLLRSLPSDQGCDFLSELKN